jgi:quercetin dioxygenase-like cupin family protein
MPSYIARREQCAHHRLFDGVDIHTFAGDKVMLSLVEFEPEAVVPWHSHPHEQMGLLLEGEMAFFIGQEHHHLRPGDMWRIPGGVEHKVIAGDMPVKALDVFHPIREDYL